MSKVDLIDALGEIRDDYILDAECFVKRKRLPFIYKAGLLAACLCLFVMAGFVVLTRFDYFNAGCGAYPGTIVGEDYYYYVPHDGIYRYRVGEDSRRILSAFFEDGYEVNESGLYYQCGKRLYRMDPASGKKTRLYTVKDADHFSFSLTNDSAVILTLYNNRKDYRSEIKIDALTGENEEILSWQLPFSSKEELYSDLHYQVGERNILLVPASDGSEGFLVTEDGKSLLTDGRSVYAYSFEKGDDYLVFEIQGKEGDEPSDSLVIFADGSERIVPSEMMVQGVCGHFLFYVDGEENSESLSGIDSGIWCYDADSGEKWQLGTDSEAEFYAFTTDGDLLYATVPWDEKQTLWKIQYEKGKPTALLLLMDSIGS